MAPFAYTLKQAQETRGLRHRVKRPTVCMTNELRRPFVPNGRYCTILQLENRSYGGTFAYEFIKNYRMEFT